jgi:hypothetical protein
VTWPSRLSHRLPGVSFGKQRWVTSRKRRRTGVSITPQRANMTLMSAFAALLAALGIFGMTAYFVSQRMHELGIRVAFGATRRAVIRIILDRGMRLTLAGLILGIAALALKRGAGSLLEGVAPNDPAAFTAAVVLLGCCGVPGSGPSRLTRRSDGYTPGTIDLEPQQRSRSIRCLGNRSALRHGLLRWRRASLHLARVWRPPIRSPSHLAERRPSGLWPRPLILASLGRFIWFCWERGLMPRAWARLR